MTTIAKWKSMCSVTCRIKQCIYNDLTALKFTTDNQSNYQLLKDLDRRTICFHGCFSGEPHVVSSSLSSFLYLLWNRTPESKWCSLYRLQLHAIPVTQPSVSALQQTTRVWANAQRDGRPAEYRWRPLFNDTKFG